LRCETVKDFSLREAKADLVDGLLLWYAGNIMSKDTQTRSAASPKTPSPSSAASLRVERVQSGVRIEKRILKVLKALAEYLDLSLGDLLEGMALHAFEGKAPFGPETLAKIEQLKSVYGLDLDASASHRMEEGS
jgi:hypothetical protein